MPESAPSRQCFGHPNRLPVFILAVLAATTTGCAYTGGVTGAVSQQRTHAIVRDAKVVFTEVGGGKRYEIPVGHGGNFSAMIREGIYDVSAQHPQLVPCDAVNTPVRIVRGAVARTEVCMQAP